MARRAAWIAAVLLVVASPAQAHKIGLSGVGASVSRSAWQLDGSVLSGDLILPRFEVIRRFVPPSEDRVLSPEATLEAQITSRVDVRRGDVPCPGEVDSPGTLTPDAFRVGLRYDCPDGDAPIRVTLGFLPLLGSDHRHLAAIGKGTGARTDVLLQSFPSFELEAGTTAPLPWGFLRLGVLHILTGFDHLVFLFGLILLGGRVRSLVGTVTAFTVAHSITLALAALGVWNPSSGFVEPAIGLTIAYVGVENLFLKQPKGRWRITFLLGLIHGFGFASALAEAGLARSQVVPALLLFNLGVEGGQLAVLSLLLPLVLWARRVSWVPTRAVPVVSVVIVAIGLGLFFTRLF